MSSDSRTLVSEIINESLTVESGLIRGVGWGVESSCLISKKPRWCRNTRVDRKSKGAGFPRLFPTIQFLRKPDEAKGERMGEKNKGTGFIKPSRTLESKFTRGGESTKPFIKSKQRILNVINLLGGCGIPYRQKNSRYKKKSA